MVEYLPTHMQGPRNIHTQKKYLLGLYYFCCLFYSTGVKSITSCVLGKHSTLEFHLAFHGFIFIGIEEMTSS